MSAMAAMVSLTPHVLFRLRLMLQIFYTPAASYTRLSTVFSQVLQTEVNAGTFSNTATVTAVSPSGASITIPKTWTESIERDFDFTLGGANRLDHRHQGVRSSLF